MARFAYRALDAAGSACRGVVEAESRQAAVEELRRRALAPFALSRAHGRIPATAGPVFLRDVSTLLAAGAPLRKALQVIALDTRTTGVAELAAALDRAAVRGDGLAEAMRCAFGPQGAFVAGLITAGQASGALAESLARGADALEEEARARAEIGAALAYPAFVLTAFFVTVWLMLTVVAPAMAPLLNDLPQGQGQGLRLLVAAGAALQHASPLLLAAGGGAAALALVLALLGVLGPIWSRFLLDGPPAGIVRGLEYGAAARAIGPMLHAGVPGAKALRIGAAGVRNGLVRARLLTAVEQVENGAAVSAALAQARGFPASIARLARIGDEAGALGLMIERGGAYARHQALARLRSMANRLAPVLIMSLGLMIAALLSTLLSGVAAIGEAALQ
jgi:type II secretory pathway component PulF